MIPFARVLKYGNTPAESPIIKVQSTDSEQPSIFVLRKNGDLYATGLNSSNIFGTNIAVGSMVNTWVKILSNVRNFWVCSNGTVALTYDNKMMFTGFYGILSPGSTGTSIGWEDKSTTFSIFQLGSINDIQMFGNGIAVLHGAHLYFMGSNYDYCMGSGGAKNSFTLVLSSVKKFCYGRRSSFALLINGNLMGTGWNGYGHLGTGSVTQLTTWTNIRTAVLDVMLSNRNSHILTSTGSLMGTGFQLDGAIGNGVVTNSYIQSYMHITNMPVDSKLFSSTDNTANISISGVISSGSNIYRTGQNNYAAIGNNTRVNVSSFTSAVKPVVLDKVTSAYARSTGTLLLNDGDVYYCGLNFAASGITGDYVMTLQKINVPA